MGGASAARGARLTRGLWKVQADEGEIVRRFMEVKEMAMGQRKAEVDILDYDEEIVALIDLPGVAKEEIDLRVSEEEIFLEAPARRPDGKYTRRERGLRFFRKVELPEEVKPEQVRARFENGVLEVHLPKLVVAPSTRVNVE